MEKTITIDGKDIHFKSTASTPRRYRRAFGRDMIIDMDALGKALKSKDGLGMAQLEVFENVAYIMAKQAAESDDRVIEASADEWLDNFETFSIYEILPEIFGLWKATNQTLSTPK